MEDQDQSKTVKSTIEYWENEEREVRFHFEVLSNFITDGVVGKTLLVGSVQEKALTYALYAVRSKLVDCRSQATSLKGLL